MSLRITLYEFNKKLSKNMSYNQIAMNWFAIYSRLERCEECGYINFINQLEIYILDKEKFYNYFGIEDEPIEDDFSVEETTKKLVILENVKCIFNRIKSFFRRARILCL